MIVARTKARAVLPLLAELALAGCQTMPAAPFSAEQVTVLESKGFRQQDGNYLLGLQNKVLFGFDSCDLQGDTRTMIGELGRELAAADRPPEHRADHEYQHHAQGNKQIKDVHA